MTVPAAQRDRSRRMIQIESISKNAIERAQRRKISGNTHLRCALASSVPGNKRRSDHTGCITECVPAKVGSG
jgi:hypothetical protein